MKVWKIVLAAVLCLCCAGTGTSRADEEDSGAAAERQSPAIVVKATSALLVKVTGSVLFVSEGEAEPLTLTSSSRPTIVRFDGRVDLMEGTAVLVAGTLRLYLTKDDRVEIYIDRKVVRPSITVPAGYSRPVTVKNGVFTQTLKPSGAVFANENRRTSNK